MVKRIKTKRDHRAALARISVLMEEHPRTGSDEYDEMELLSILVSDYEERKYPIDPPDPIEAIKFRLDQLGMTISDLAGILGSKSRASEILNGKRKLSLSMIRRLHHALEIPASTLIAEYKNINVVANVMEPEQKRVISTHTSSQKQ